MIQMLNILKKQTINIKEEIEKDPELREQFTDDQLGQIEAGDTPEGYVWHHSEEPGTLQLVDTTTHTQTGHTGGRTVYGVAVVKIDKLGGKPL